MANCRKRGHGLFIEFEDYVEEQEGYEQEPQFDATGEDEEQLVQGDDGPLLVIRRACFTPRKGDDNDWLRNNIFQSTCTIGGKVCRFVIDSGSCENVVSDEAVQKLALVTKTHPNPYKLSWLKKGTEVTVSKRCLVPFSIGAKYKDSVWCDVMRVIYYWEGLGNMIGMLNLMERRTLTIFGLTKQRSCSYQARRSSLNLLRRTVTIS